MYCPSCGAKVDEGSRVCPACGCFVDQGPMPPQASPVMPEDAPVSSGEIREVPAASHGVPQVPVNASRSLLTWIVLTFLTCGIYSWYFIYTLANDMNRICQGDNEETPGLLVFILLSIVTCGFYSYWWYYKIGNRMQANAPRYGLMFQENGTTILLWMIVGLLLCGLGPFVAMYIIIKNSNALAAAYNARLVRA